MTTMNEALKKAGIRKSRNANKAKNTRQYVPANEGRDHYNIGPDSKFQWASRLWHGYLNFTHPVLGPFPNLNNFMLYISSKNGNREDFRSMSVAKANAIINAHRDRIYRDFIEELDDAYRCILTEHESLRKHVETSPLHIVSYGLFKSPVGHTLPVVERCHREVSRIFRDIRRELQVNPVANLLTLTGHYDDIIAEFKTAEAEALEKEAELEVGNGDEVVVEQAAIEPDPALNSVSEDLMVTGETEQAFVAENTKVEPSVSDATESSTDPVSSSN